jgi:hypothetical protein
MSFGRVADIISDPHSLSQEPPHTMLLVIGDFAMSDSLNFKKEPPSNLMGILAQNYYLQSGEQVTPKISTIENGDIIFSILIT